MKAAGRGEERLRSTMAQVARRGLAAEAVIREAIAALKVGQNAQALELLVGHEKARENAGG